MINIQRCVVRHASKCRVHGQITIDKILVRAKSSGAHPTAGIIGNVGKRIPSIIVPIHILFRYYVSYFIQHWMT